MRYFDHDTTASKDDGIMALRCEHGSAAVDAYWAIIEKMYADEAPVNRLGTKPLTVWLAVGFEQLQTYIDGMIEHGLLECDGCDPDMVYSARVMDNIAAYQAKCETARQNGKKGGRKPTRKPNANRVGSDAETARKADAKLRKEKKGMGFDKQNPIPGASVAGGEDPAPHGAVIDWAFDDPDRMPTVTDPRHDRAATEAAKRRAEAEAMDASAVDCPEHVMAQAMAALGGAR